MSVETIPVYSAEIASKDIAVTEAAAEQLGRLFGEVEDDDIEAVRIYVAGGGCGGMTYGMTCTDQRSKYDKVYKGDGFDIYVDAVALHYRQGVEIDYETRDTGAIFVFNNVFQATGGSGTCSACGAAGGGCA